MSVHVHIHMVTHAIPNTFGIAVPAVVVLTVNQCVLVVDRFLQAYPDATVRTVDMSRLLFLHDFQNLRIGLQLIPCVLWVCA